MTKGKKKRLTAKLLSSLKRRMRDAVIGPDMQHVETRLKVKTPLGEEERIYRRVQDEPDEES